MELLFEFLYFSGEFDVGPYQLVTLESLFGVQQHVDDELFVRFFVSRMLYNGFHECQQPRAAKAAFGIVPPDFVMEVFRYRGWSGDGLVGDAVKQQLQKGGWASGRSDLLVV